MQRPNDITKTSRRGEEKYSYRKGKEKENFRRKIRVIIAMLRRRTGGGSGITSRSCTSWLRQTSEDRVFPPREIIILDGSESGKICRVYSLLHCRSFLLSTNSVFLNLPFPALRFFNNNPMQFRVSNQQFIDRQNRIKFLLLQKDINSLLSYNCSYTFQNQLDL